MTYDPVDFEAVLLLLFWGGLACLLLLGIAEGWKLVSSLARRAVTRDVSGSKNATGSVHAMHARPDVPVPPVSNTDQASQRIASSEAQDEHGLSQFSASSGGRSSKIPENVRDTSWTSAPVLSNITLIRLPFKFDDPVHPNFWLLRVPLPAHAQIQGIAIEASGSTVAPSVLASAHTSRFVEMRMLILSSERQPLNRPAGSLPAKAVRYIGSFSKVVGRLGGAGWRGFMVFEVIGHVDAIEPRDPELPLVARRVKLEEILCQFAPSDRDDV